MWLAEDQRTPYKHMFERDWTASSINYFTLNSVYNWEDLCIQLRNQQICTSDNHDYVHMGGCDFQSVLLIFHHRFANATRN